MMFWTRSSANDKKPSDSTATAPEAAAASIEEETTDTPSAFVLSDQRRQELLRAARANRVSWIEGRETPQTPTHNPSYNGTNPLVYNAHASVASSGSYHPTLASIVNDLESFCLQLQQWKHMMHKPQDNDTEFHSMEKQPRPEECINWSMAYELQQKQEQVAMWKQNYYAQKASVSMDDRRRLKHSHKEKEMMFFSAYDELLKVLKHPQASDIVYQIQTFVNQVESEWNVVKMLQERAAADRPGGRIHAFIDKMVQQLHHQHKLASVLHEMDAVPSLLHHEDAISLNPGESLLHEALEAFVMEKLYDRLLTLTPDAADEDQKLHDRIASLSFVQFQHLDLVPPSSAREQAAWDQLIHHIKQLSRYKSPRRQMDCILSVCQQLTALLSTEASDGSRRYPSADEFLPGLIYLLLKANPVALKRTTNYILEYRHPSQLVSEPGYFFTHVVSSVAFLEQVDASLLTISAEEYERGVQQTTKRQTSNTADCDTRKQEQKQDTAAPLSSVLDIRARRLAAMQSQYRPSVTL